MAVIKVILGGCGVNIKDAHGKMRHVLKTPESAPFEVDDEQAARLVGLDVAEYVNEPSQEPAEGGDAEGGQMEPEGNEGGEEGAQEAKEPKEPEEPEEKLVGHMDPAELELMTVENLKKLAADMGLDASKCRKKADYVALISAVEVEIEDDELPELNAADPE